MNESGTETETLICENGNHEWSRKRTKGRKPRFCLEHSPVAATQTATVSLTCAAGHTWERPRTKGKLPKWCPEHKPQVASEPHVRVLKCAEGHEFEWAKKGKAPKFCPEHKPEKTTAHTKVGGSGVPKVDFDNELVNQILDAPGSSDLQRKLRYIVNEFRNPRSTRDVGDWRLLHYSYNRLLEEAARALRQSVTVQHIPLEV